MKPDKYDDYGDFSFKSLFSPFTSTKAIILLIIIGVIVYGNMFLNGFVGDDPGYINHPFIQQFQILKLIDGGSTDLGGSSPVTSQFYRPMMLISFAQIYQFFGDAAFFYHLFQLILHISNALLIFFLLQRFFRKSLALGLSLIFLVHPINVETVAYVSDLQDILFVFFGLASLNLLARKGELSLMKQSLVGVLLLLSLLSKETGILFVFIIVLYQIFFNVKQKLVKVVVPLVGAIVVYGLIRFAIASVWIAKSPASPLSELSLSERLIHIPKIFVYYLSTFFYPQNLAMGQTWIVRQITEESFFIPLFVVILFSISLLAGGIWLYKQNRQELRLFLFFCFWFILGMIIHMQIIALEMTVATRWFYFPIIGLLGMIGVIVNVFFYRKKINIFFGGLFIMLMIAFSFHTFNRLSDWRDAITLYEHDASQTQSYLVEHSLGYEHLQQGNLSEAKKHFEASVNLFANPINTNSMGVYYHQIKNIPEARKWFYRSNSLGDYYLAYQNQARLLLTNDKVEVAQPYIEKALQKFPQSDTFWYLLAIAKYKKGDKTGALDAAEKAYGISPGQDNTYVVSQLRNNLPLKLND